jgi:glycosyltransferase involved in cell wall biosynthesis
MIIRPGNIPIISIVTIVHNGIAYLGRAIRSVLSQDYAGLQYIIIDGGSTDGTIDLLKKYEGKSLSWLSEPDRGISDAFNKGIKIAAGELIGILNADDWYEQGALSEVANAHRESPQAVVHGRLRYWRDAQTPYYEFGGDDSSLRSYMSVNHPTVFVPRVIYEEHGLFDLKYRYAMDYDLMLRFKLAGVQFVYLDTVLANMLLEGVSDRQWLETLKEAYTIRKNNGVGFVKNQRLFYFAATKMFFRRYLEKMGADALVEAYRRRTFGKDKLRL